MQPKTESVLDTVIYTSFDNQKVNHPMTSTKSSNFGPPPKLSKVRKHAAAQHLMNSEMFPPTVSVARNI